MGTFDQSPCPQERSYTAMISTHHVSLQWQSAAKTPGGHGLNGNIRTDKSAWFAVISHKPSPMRERGKDELQITGKLCERY